MNEGEVRSRLSRLLGPGPEVDPLRERLRTRRKRAAAACAPPAGLVPDLSGEVLARTTDLDARSLHGRFALEEIGFADPRAIAWLARDPSLAAFDLSRALFLDTETSGLSGGAGTWVFLVGLGWFEAVGVDRPRFRVWQGFLSEPAGESALLGEVARRIRSAGAVVSFFGKSFDRHRLEDKMRIHGIEPPFAGRPHLDLYHPLRRLYRPRAGGGLDDARLKTFERALCGVEREDDLPGAMAPAAWFDFLHRRPHDLEGVFRHNRDDVLSLVTLAAHLGRTLHESRAGGEELPGPPAARAREVAKALVLAREPALSIPWFDRAAGRGDGRLPEDCARLLGRARRALRKLEKEKEEGPGRAGALSESEGDPRSQLQCGTDPRPLL